MLRRGEDLAGWVREPPRGRRRGPAAGGDRQGPNLPGRGRRGRHLHVDALPGTTAQHARERA